MEKTSILCIFLIMYKLVCGQPTSEYKTVILNANEALIEKPLPPILNAGEIKFIDKNFNNQIDALEECMIEFEVSNNGKGTARNLCAILSNSSSSIKGLNFQSNIKIGSIAPNSKQILKIPISGSIDLTSGTANFQIQFNEAMGQAPDPIFINFDTKAFSSPAIEIVDYKFLSDNGKINLGLPIQLKILVQNKGQGVGENVKLVFIYPELVVPNGDELFNLGTLQPGESKEIIFDFIATKKYASQTLELTAKLTEKHGKFSKDKSVTIEINAQSGGKTVEFKGIQQDNVSEIKEASLTSDVDKDIPIKPTKYQNRFALIIGNEDYSNTVESSIRNVKFAKDDATSFYEYCYRILGIPKENIQLILDANPIKMKQEINLVCEKIKRLNGMGELYFYYSGHGSPDEKTKTPYLIPVGLEVSNISEGINVADLYSQITKSNAKRTTVFLDACFTGLSENSKFITPVAPTIPNEGNIVVFAATESGQAAEPYMEKKHGMFTYFLLQKLKESKGEISYVELGDYLKQKVGITSLNVNRKAQDPQINASKDLNNEWETWHINE